MRSSRRREIFYLVAGIACPVLVALYFVQRFGVNLPAHDEWNFMPTVSAFYNGYAWPALLLEHYGEHRIPLPKAVILALAPFTKLNVKVEMYLSAMLMLACALMCWRLIVRTNSPRWTIVPVGWLLLSTAQAENLLVGWQFQIPLMNACVVGAIVMARTALSLRRRAAVAAAGLAATFSFANGLMIWPALIVFTLLRREPIRNAAGWAAVGCAAFWLYHLGYTGYHRTPGDAAPDYFASIARDPGGVLALFAGTAGNNFSAGTIPSYVVAGLVLLSLAAALVWRSVKESSTDSAPWIGLLVFSVLSAAAVAFGRGHEWRVFLTPLRYLSISMFVPVSVVVLGAAWLRRQESRPRIAMMLAAVVAIAAVWLHIGTVASAWELAEADRQMKIATRACVLDFRHAADDCLRRIYAPDPQRVREYSAMLERWHLGPFATVNVDQCVDAGTIQGTLDAVTFEATQSGVVVNIEGWALDARGGKLDSVAAELDGTLIGSTTDFFDRPDVSAFFHKPAGRTGWRIRASIGRASPGEHHVEAIIQASQCRQSLPARTVTY